MNSFLLLVPFLEEIEDSKKAFRNYLTFNGITEMHLQSARIEKKIRQSKYRDFQMNPSIRRKKDHQLSKCIFFIAQLKGI